MEDCQSCLWPPYVVGQAIIVLPCGFFLLLSSIFFSSPNLSDRRLDVYHTSRCGPSANLECRYETRCAWLAGNAGLKKIAKKLVKQQYVLHMSPQYGELRPTSG